MKRIIKLATLILALALSLSLLSACGDSGSKADGGKIDTTVILVLEDGSEQKYDLNVSSGLTIREALYEAELITDDDLYAMFVENIDGHIADTMNDGVTWLPCDMDGNQLPVSGDVISAFDSYILEDGGSIKLVYYVVPSFDD